MSNIEWLDYIWEKEKAVDLKSINQFEDSVDVKLPNEYLECLVSNQGKTPEPSSIKVRNGVDMVTILLHSLTEEKDPDNYIYSIYKQHNLLAEDQSSLLIPFAEAGGSSIFCFDYRDKKDNPAIVFINTDLEGDEAIIPIADSFASFLEMLYQSED